MSQVEQDRLGVMGIPITGYENGVATCLVIGPLEENEKKLGERCLLVEGSKMETLEGKQEFPGGGVKEGESLFDALLRELSKETGVPIGRERAHEFKFIFEDVPIDQLRPDLTHFKVATALWFIDETEKAALIHKGAQEVLLDVVSGTVFSADNMEQVTLRPAHRDILNYVCQIARSLAMAEEKVFLHEELVND